MKIFSQPAYNKVRLAKRASYDWSDISDIIDNIPIGHVSFIQAGRPFVIPLNVWRMGDFLYLHCLKGGRLSLQLLAQDMACISFAVLDAWVLSKSAFHTSANYHSVVVHGKFHQVIERAELDSSFKTLLNGIQTKRWEKVRHLSAKEIKMTSVLRFEIENASAKSRTGLANEDKNDLGLSVPAGIIPLKLLHGELEDVY